MPDTFSIYQSTSPTPVDGSEGKSKRLLNVAGDDLYYRADPGVSTSDAKLKAGEAAVVTARVWIITPTQTQVLVEAADDGVGDV